ncbi:hypothetical protein EYV94_21495 [Puteibacter caeruleilacunae]|nr:hypothetical protein EYV94_21495 [Puteibacter caeruleilacunae]
MRSVLLFAISLILSVTMSFGQSIEARTFVVRGDMDKFYPVVFKDAGWSHGATELEISRASVHIDNSWRGSVIAMFRFHTSRWGHQSHFVDVDIKHYLNVFIADYHDACGLNNSQNFIIWLRGGSTTYYYRSVNSNLPEPVVYDGVANSLPFQEENGPAHTYKTTLSPKLNQNGLALNYPAYFLGAGTNYMEGKLGIGTKNTGENRLAVNGSIRAKEIVVDGTDWADFVFAKDYQLMPLEEVAKYIEEQGHLPLIPDTKTVKEKGISVGEINTKLLQKIEELTLYIIDQDKKMKDFERKLKEAEQVKEEMQQLKNQINRIEEQLNNR